MSFISVRMRASYRGKHVSGAERIVKEEFMDGVVRELIRRPKIYDSMVITIEKLESVEYIEKALRIESYEFKSVKEAREFAVKKLTEAGIDEYLARRGVEILSKGANPKGGNMRGAVLLDIKTGERVEPDKERGIRTVRVDWENREEITELLLKEGFTRRTVDALALATKNVYCGVIAELCWSDDPDYITGYVASEKTGYVRITPLKEKGDPLGGRVYFIDGSRREEIIKCLEKRAFLIKSLHL